MALDKILHELMVFVDAVNDEFADRCEPREKELEVRETRLTFLQGEMRSDTRAIV